MASKQGAPIKGKIIRIVAEDVCGVPVTGAGSRVTITNSFTKVEVAWQYEDGTEFFERTADGALCVNDKDAPILKRAEVSVDLCVVDPDMMPQVMSARELTTTGPVSGTGFAITSGAPTSHFSVEVWQALAGSGACDPSGAQQFIYVAFPHCKNTRIQNYTIENAKSVLSFQCETADPSLLWGDGPGTGSSWLPAGAGGFISAADHMLWNITTVTPPVPPGTGFIALT